MCIKIAKEAASNTSNHVDKIHKVIISNLQTKREKEKRGRKLTINLCLGWDRRQCSCNDAGLQLLWGGGVPKLPASGNRNASLYSPPWKRQEAMLLFIGSLAYLGHLFPRYWEGVHGLSDARQGFFYWATASGQGDWELSCARNSSTDSHWVPRLITVKVAVRESAVNTGFVGSYEVSLRINSQKKNL